MGGGHRVGLPGDGIDGFMEALRKRHDDLRFVHVRHEEVHLHLGEEVVAALSHDERPVVR